MRNSIFVKNLTKRPVTIGDLPFVPSIQPKKIENLLSFYTKIQIYQSENLVQMVRSGMLKMTVKQDGVSTSKKPSKAATALSFAEEDEVSVSVSLPSTIFRADQYASVQAALNAANSAGGGTVLVETDYTLAISLNMEGFKGVHLVGTGMGHVDTVSSTGSVLHFSMTSDSQPCISLIGAQGCGMSNIAIEGEVNGSNIPSVGVLLGRFTGAVGGPFHTFQNVNITGNFRKFNLAILGSEVNNFDYVKMWNWQDGGNNVLISRYNVFDLTSPFSTVIEDHTTCTDIMFQKCFTGVYGKTGTESNIIITAAVHNVHIWGHDASNKPNDAGDLTTGGKAAILFDYVDIAYNANSSELRTRGVYIRDSLFETWGAKNAVMFNHHTSGVRLENCRFNSMEASIAFTRNAADAASFGVLNVFDFYTAGCDFISNQGTHTWSATGGVKPVIHSLNAAVVDSQLDLRRRDATAGGGSLLGGNPAAPATKIIFAENPDVAGNWQGNEIFCTDYADIDLTGDNVPINKIVAIRDQAGLIRREYLGEGSSTRPTVLNWKARDHNSADTVVDGDIAIHKDPGAGTPVYFAYYDNGTWRTVQLTGTGLPDTSV